MRHLDLLLQMSVWLWNAKYGMPQGVYNLWMFCAGMGLNNLDDSRDSIGKFISRNPDTCLVAEAVTFII